MKAQLYTLIQEKRLKKLINKGAIQLGWHLRFFIYWILIIVSIMYSLLKKTCKMHFLFFKKNSNHLNFSGSVTLKDKICPHLVQTSATTFEPSVKNLLVGFIVAYPENKPSPISLHPQIGHSLFFSIQHALHRK